MTPNSDRTVYLSDPSPVSMTDWYYDLASLDHFWVRRRFEVLKRMADPLLRSAAHAAEIGCGNGLLQRSIEDHYGIPVAGFELNEVALQKNVSRVSPLYCYDIHQHYPEFRAHFDVLLVFDVLEHIENEAAFLESIKYHLAGSGTLLINVPAHRFLYSAYDRAAGHFRRYSIKSLAATVEPGGFKLRSITYWGMPLAPLLLARKVLGSIHRSQQQAYSAGFSPGRRSVNSALALLAHCEPLPQKICGTSVMAVFENQA